MAICSSATTNWRWPRWRALPKPKWRSPRPPRAIRSTRTDLSLDFYRAIRRVQRDHLKARLMPAR
jgi:hypothetical protein